MYLRGEFILGLIDVALELLGRRSLVAAVHTRTGRIVAAARLRSERFGGRRESATIRAAIQMAKWRIRDRVVERVRVHGCSR